MDVFKADVSFYRVILLLDIFHIAWFYIFTNRFKDEHIASASQSWSLFCLLLFHLSPVIPLVKQDPAWIAAITASLIIA